MQKSNGLGILYFISAVAALGGFLFGYDTGVINGTQFYFSKYFELSAATKGWVVGSALVGCFVGALAAGLISKLYGRKRSLMVSSLLFTISAWGSGLPGFVPETIPVLVFFRIVGGLGIGMASMNAPMYIAELSPARIRGKMVTLYQMAIVLGFFIVFIVTYYIGGSQDETYNLEHGWRVMFWTELIPCVVFFGLLFFVPRSPRWLLLKGKEEEARQVLTKIHGEENAILEIQEIKQSIHQDSGFTFKEILKKGVFPIILVGCVFSLLQQLTGINAVLYYGADIFEKALGFGQKDILAQQVLLAGVNVGFTILAMVTVDRWGRKPLVISGSIGMIVGFSLLGLTIMLNKVGIASLIGILIFIGSFAMSMGPIVWVVLAEMFPNSIRSVGMSIAVAVQWGGNYLVSQTFPIIVDSSVNTEGFWNGSLPYFIFMFFIGITIFFTNQYIPETKGKTLESIENIWEEKYGKIQSTNK